MEAVEPCRAVVVGLILGCRAAGWKAVDGLREKIRRGAVKGNDV